MNLKRIALASAAVAALAVGPALAYCDPAPTFGTAGNTFCSSNPNGGICNVQTPGNNIKARFWGLNQGNFASDDNNTSACDLDNNCGADNGTWQSDDANEDGTIGWVLDDGTGNWVIFGAWDGAGARASRVDGCPTVQAGETRRVMLFGISDQDATGNGYFAIAWAGELPGVKADFDISNIGGAPPNELGTGAGNIILRQVPRPFVAASQRTGPTTHNFTIQSPTFASISNGLYGDDQLLPSEAVQGFRIYTNIVPRGALAPANLRSAGWTAAGATQPFGAPNTVVPVTCATNSDVYFAFSIVANSGFEMVHVGTTRAGQCGPTIADPADPKIKPIDRPKKNVNPNN